MKYFFTALFVCLFFALNGVWAQDSNKEKFLDSLLTVFEHSQKLDSVFEFYQESKPYAVSIHQIVVSPKRKNYILHLDEFIGFGYNFSDLFICEKVNNQWLKRRIEPTSNGGVIDIQRRDANFDGITDLVLYTTFHSMHSNGGVLFFLVEPNKQQVIHDKNASILVHRDTILFKQEKKEILNEYGGRQRVRELYQWKTPFELVKVKEISLSSANETEANLTETEYLPDPSKKGETIKKEKIQKMPNEQAFEYFEKWGL